MNTRAAFLLSLLLIAAPAALAGEWGARGASRDFAIAGERLAIADGRGVSLYGTDPLSRVGTVETGSESRLVVPFGQSELAVLTNTVIERVAILEGGPLARLGETPAPAGTVAIAANDRYVAAAAGKNVHLYERDGTGLALRRSLAFSGNVTAVALGGDELYVSIDRVATKVLDADTAEQIGSIPFVARDLALDGETLWAIWPDAGIARIDVSDPASPRITGRRFPDGIVATQIAASGDRLIALEPPNRVHLLASEPEEIRLLSSAEHWAATVAMRGATVWIAGPMIDAETLPLETGVVAQAFRIEGSALVPESAARDLAGPVSGVWTDGSIAYVIDHPFLRVLDVSRSAMPREIYSLEVPQLQDKIRVKGNIAIAYGRAWVNLFDVSQPRAPRLMATWHTQGHPRGAAAIAGSRIVEANEHSGMHVFEYSSLAQPRMVGWRIWHYHDVAAAADAIYALQQFGLLVLELGADEKPVARAEIDFGGPEQVDIAPPNSDTPEWLVASDRDRLRIFTLGNRFLPVETGSVWLGHPAVFGTGNRVAWFVHEDRLHRVNLAASAVVAATEDRAIAPAQISVAGEKVVIADRYSVRVYGPDTAPRSGRRRAVR